MSKRKEVSDERRGGNHDDTQQGIEVLWLQANENDGCRVHSNKETVEQTCANAVTSFLKNAVNGSNGCTKEHQSKRKNLIERQILVIQ